MLIFTIFSKNPLTNPPCVAIIQKLSDSIIEFGGIAQLGERLNGIQEVSGSIPLISTNEHLKSKDFRCFSVSNQLISSNMNTFV